MYTARINAALAVLLLSAGMCLALPVIHMQFAVRRRWIYPQ